MFGDCLIHFGAGVTDCGREVDELPDGELCTTARGLVSCGECVDAYAHLRRSVKPDPVGDVLKRQIGLLSAARNCSSCGCTDEDCSGCIERTGSPCRWLERGICSACVEPF